MSFGTSIGDGVLLAQLAWQTLQGAKQACGEHDELTREVNSLYKVLNRLQLELANPQSLVSRVNDERQEELEEHATGCEGILKVMNSVLKKYNALGPDQRRGKRLWQKIRFGNGEMKDLSEIRIKLSAHTSAIIMSLNLCSLDSLGRVETILGRVESESSIHGQQLRGIRRSLHWVAANMTANVGDGSVWTSYTNDDKSFWRSLRHELVNEGHKSSALQKHKRLIMAYIEELGNRGVFDDHDRDEPEYIHEPQHGHRMQHPEADLQPSSETDISSPIPSAVEPETSHPPNMIDSVENNGNMDHSTIEDAAISSISSLAFDETDPDYFDASNVVSTNSHNLAFPLESTNHIETTQPDVTISQRTNHNVKRPLRAYIEEVVDEEFAVGLHLNVTKTNFSAQSYHDIEPVNAVIENETGMQPVPAVDQESQIDPVGSLQKDFPDRSTGSPKPVSWKAAHPVQIEEVVDEEFDLTAHPNVISAGSSQSATSAEPGTSSEKVAEENHQDAKPEPSQKQDDRSNIIDSPTRSQQSTKKAQKQVSFATLDPEENQIQVKLHPEELRFIFYREFRDFDSYQELQESYQALFDEKEAVTTSSNVAPQLEPNTSTFITHSPYTPPATMHDLQYYCIPASYFHTFWHPQRVPMYLHGNVFDGISFTNWLYGWTSYTFGESSFRMAKTRTFGNTVQKLGAALTDIEHASNPQKQKLPNDLYDQSDILWKDLENIINDIMSEAEDHLESTRRRNRLEVEFVRRFCQAIVVGPAYHDAIESFIERAESWCKIVRFHPDFIMLWITWEK